MSEMISAHFSRHELECRDHCGLCNVTPELISLIEHVRTILNEPMIVHSCCRCKKHNAEVGGSPKSKHLTGNALDFSCKTLTPEMIYNRILKAHWSGLLQELGGIGIYNTFVHVDTEKAKDGHLRRWDMRHEKKAGEKS